MFMIRLLSLVTITVLTLGACSSDQTVVSPDPWQPIKYCVQFVQTDYETREVVWTERHVRDVFERFLG